MRCPKCNAKADCLDSRWRKELVKMYRRYKCDSCGLRFTTREVYDPEPSSRTPKEPEKPKAFIKRL